MANMGSIVCKTGPTINRLEDDESRLSFDNALIRPRESAVTRLERDHDVTSSVLAENAPTACSRTYLPQAGITTINYERIPHYGQMA